MGRELRGPRTLVILENVDASYIAASTYCVLVSHGGDNAHAGNKIVFSVNMIVFGPFGLVSFMLNVTNFCHRCVP